jgi:succinate-semialdehyde dehydrogenase / glutarate-semialdehyde dehydrogenase
MASSSVLTSKGSEIAQIDLLIGGQSRPSSSRQRWSIRSPATGEIVGSIASATREDVLEAVESAQQAFLRWSNLTPYEREKIIRAATTYVRGKSEEIGRLMALEQGKPFNQSKSEIAASCDTLDYYAAEGLRVEGTVLATEDRNYRSSVIYQPLGVCALITPWNYPVSLLSWKLGPALATGCTVVVKPSPVTPMSPTAFCAALIEGGVPAGVVSVVNSEAVAIAEELVTHPLVAKVAMTGSTHSGKRLMELVAPSLKRISLELGGQCPAIICADADLDLAAKVVAYKGFRNMGQSCSSVNRVYVHASAHDAFVEKLRTLAEKQTIGDGAADGSVDLGPMATAASLTKVKEHVADALKKGATLVYGGAAPDGELFARGNFYLPTILASVTTDMLVMRDETFGPVVPVASFRQIEEAVRQANDTSWGLVAYLFARDYATITRVCEALEAGTVCVNNGAVNTNYAPYSGWKDSGFGLELSRDAVFEYLKIKHIKIALS